MIDQDVNNQPGPETAPVEGQAPGVPPPPFEGPPGPVRVQGRRYLILAALAVLLILAGGGYYFFFSSRPFFTRPSPTPSPPVEKPTLQATPTLRPEVSPGQPLPTQMPHQDLSKKDSEFDLSCFNTFALADKEREFVVNSQKEYEELLIYKSLSPNCQNVALPEIDFSQKTLLGKYAQGAGCSVDFVKRVYRDDTSKKIIFLVEVVEQGICERSAMNMNWILISKIPSGYVVQFGIK